MLDIVITRVWRKCYQRGDYARGYVQFFPIYMETSYYMRIFQPTFPYIFSHRFFIKLLYVETTYPIYRTVKVEGKVKKTVPNGQLAFELLTFNSDEREMGNDRLMVQRVVDVMIVLLKIAECPAGFSQGYDAFSTDWSLDRKEGHKFSQAFSMEGKQWQLHKQWSEWFIFLKLF